MLGWSQDQLSVESKVSRPTIAEFERGARVPFEANLASMRRAFEDAGIIFIEEGEASQSGGAGLRMKKRGKR
jgi:transcriptional regulator with XRE-family HTH domain